MAKARHYLPLKALLTLYNAMIYPYLTYCSIIWASTYPTRLKPILRTQKKIVRIITFANYTEKARPFFMSLKILNIYELNKYLTAMFMYSYHHDKLPAFLDSLFQTSETVHSYNKRSASKVHREFKRTNYGKFSVRFKEQLRGTAFPLTSETQIRSICSKVNLKSIFNIIMCKLPFYI